MKEIALFYYSLQLTQLRVKMEKFVAKLVKWRQIHQVLLFTTKLNNVNMTLFLGYYYIEDNYWLIRQLI